MFPARLIRGLILVGIGVPVLAQEPLTGLTAYLHPPEGRVLTGTIRQRQYDDVRNEAGEVILFAAKWIGVLTEREYVEVRQDTIRTYRFATKQVLVDSYDWDVFNIFQLLSGDFSRVTTLPPREDASRWEVPFEIPDEGLSGTVQIRKSDYRPLQVKVQYDPETSFTVRVDSARSPARRPAELNGIPWEVIDLRE
ncbi:MAG: hypothetical protein D6762_03145 [Candidatus Neomarinimicrobiota bacterium]|nr:MAG: hypothetical protein D6762_03145 [Candidatus Neomarinimicrobiota bacterium]